MGGEKVESGNCRGGGEYKVGWFLPLGPSGDDWRDVFVELVVNDGAPGLAVDADAPVRVTIVTRLCFEGFFANGERGRGRLDCPPLLRPVGLVVTEGIMLDTLRVCAEVGGSTTDQEIGIVGYLGSSESRWHGSWLASLIPPVFLHCVSCLCARAGGKGRGEKRLLGG